jgi:uncharacterized membrane protein
MSTKSTQQFFSADEVERVVAAIQEAESGTSGEIRVHLQRHCPGDPLALASKIFVKSGMEATACRNGVILFIATEAHRFAIYGDQGIHAKVGEAYWAAIRDALAADFARGAFCEGVCRAIAEIGGVLKTAFPRECNDVNELPDAPSFGNE